MPHLVWLARLHESLSFARPLRWQERTQQGASLRKAILGRAFASIAIAPTPISDRDAALIVAFHLANDPCAAFKIVIFGELHF